MITNDEKRRVAAALRENTGKGVPLILNVAFAAFDVDPVSLERQVSSDEAALRLADLIEPKGIESEAFKPVESDGVDREALLALAGCARKMGEGYDKTGSYELGVTFRAIADRIREACGEAV